MSKSVDANGAWINGNWHPNGAQAARTGAIPPEEAIFPSDPRMQATWDAEWDANNPPEAPAKKGSKKSAAITGSMQVLDTGDALK